MLDAAARKIVDPPLNAIGGWLESLGAKANSVSILGFIIGMSAIPALAYEEYGIGLTLILVNRVFDGLDGAIARRTGATDFGAFLDIVLDFVFYSGVVFGFALAQTEFALAASFLMFCFVTSGSTFLAYAILAAKHGRTTEDRGKKSIYYLGGLTEGTETILFFIAICLFPDFFPILAFVFGVLCLITATTRIDEARALAAEIEDD